MCLVHPVVAHACVAGGSSHLKLLNTGVRVFARVPGGGDHRIVFRPTEEGLAHVLPFVTKRRVGVAKEDLALALSAAKGRTVAIDRFSARFQAAVAKERDASGVGPVVLVLDDNSNSDDADAAAAVEALPVWIGEIALSVLVDKRALDEQRTRLLARLG